MNSGGDLATNSFTPGLLNAANALFTNPAPLLAPGTTAQRPSPDPIMYNRMRFNTDLQQFEWYSSSLVAWVQVSNATNISDGPYVTYTADVRLVNAFNLGSLPSGLLKQVVALGISTPAIAVLGTDYFGPTGSVPSLGTMAAQNANAVNISGGSAVLTSGQVANAPAAATDIVNLLALQTALLNVNTFSARVATTANFSSTYSPGIGGVGATLTATANGAASIDGVSLSVNDVVLFKNQSSTFQNGLYYLSTNGTGGTPAIFTRSTDYDQPAEILPGDLISVVSGTVNANSSWQQTATVNAVGTDPILFSKFSQFGVLPSPFIVGSTSVTTSGTQLNLLNTLTLVPLTKVVTQVFTSNGTYTPTTGMKYCYVHAVGGGGAGGGGVIGVAGTCGIGAGGASGAEIWAWFDAATIGASQSVIIGAGGTGVSAGNGTAGGATSFGSLIVAGGGSGGDAGANSSTAIFSVPGVGGPTTTVPVGQLGRTGQSGLTGFTLSGQVGVPGQGGQTTLSGGGRQAVGGNSNGGAASGPGGGGAGAYAVTTNNTGGNGSSGVIFVTELLAA